MRKKLDTRFPAVSYSFLSLFFFSFMFFEQKIAGCLFSFPYWFYRFLAIFFHGNDSATGVSFSLILTWD
jgi:hypothetical protein